MMIDVNFYLLGYHTENSLAIMFFNIWINNFVTYTIYCGLSVKICVIIMDKIV